MGPIATKPKISAIAPWFGGKRTLAPTIVAELGEHSAYFEPFCGSMAVLFAKPPSAHETVNDLHGDLINLARVLASESCGELYDRLLRTLSVEQHFKTARTTIMENAPEPAGDPSVVGRNHVERAYWYFIFSWVGRNGVAGTRRSMWQMAVRWTPGGGHGGQRFAAAVDSLPWWHRRLRRVTILNRDAFEIIPRIEDMPDVAVYVDPPYLRNTCGRCRYAFDFEDDGHLELAKSLHRFHHARVVVSYYDDPVLEDLYSPDRWTKRLVYGQKNLHVSNRRGTGRTTAPEVLLINGPSNGEDQEGLFG